MSETDLHAQGGFTEKEDSAKTHGLIAYGLMLAGAFTGILWLVGAIWAMLKRADARGTRFEDHYQNMVTTFWWGLGLALLGVVLIPFGLGLLVLFAMGLWTLYRLIKGLIRLMDNRSFQD
ncbi:DUF4870 family protein [Ferrimonas futtsuensis]|uniref:DUF4870 family protein n=1 Tax=Ferrimonas futtsuensis TaxID=364764 RepID=UPI00040F640B|nr:hypothetical protein [Ferrimonas futtsuensis]